MTTLISQLRSSLSPFTHVAPSCAPDIPERLRRFSSSAQFKRLLDRWRRQQIEQRIHSLAVLSLLEGEGKTFCAAALAIGHASIFAERVLVLDAAPRGPRKLSALRLSDALGADLEGSRELPRPTAFPRVELITQPGEGSATLRDYDLSLLLTGYREHYALVLVDTGAIHRGNGDHSDPLVLAGQCDRAALLLSPRSAVLPPESGWSAALRASHVRPLGVITNEGNHG